MDEHAAWRRRQLLRWYSRHRRELPWRAAPGERPHPYRVWVSEIMLQQTRVSAAIPFYERFLERFPDVPALSRAPASAVLAAWSGLGYYRRARRLHAAAQQVLARHGGRLPADMAALRGLPGIGAYTAGAIASIAFGWSVPAVDGNARRIASRLQASPLSLARATAFWTAALPLRRAGEFNQAIMDLGANVCLPRAPRCPQCPLRRRCRGPLAAAPKPRPQRAVVRHYVLARRGGKLWLRQRPGAAAQMPGLWELPSTPRAAGEALATLRHSITDTRITAHVYAGARALGAGKWFTPADARAAPLTGLTRKILQRQL
ncbi:MAG: A/G-specific adenine glycosylase [Terriglobales bacterium]